MFKSSHNNKEHHDSGYKDHDSRKYEEQYGEHHKGSHDWKDTSCNDSWDDKSSQHHWEDKSYQHEEHCQPHRDESWDHSGGYGGGHH
ncbi:hypothetical protein [Pseudonocardia sp. N23]|uniref:hypothetical protein n=1 Tax=Pseudonocardia sp. N23 TaxID=1987376 RepID=UPI000BFD744B|nr:hypothetical protein [Pseudonocardia sp. N23]GAY11451.1 hypothetical protein TOK_5961 [Pseudonocardia sp. N23]